MTDYELADLRLRCVLAAMGWRDASGKHNQLLDAEQAAELMMPFICGVRRAFPELPGSSPPPRPDLYSNWYRPNGWWGR